MNNTKLYLVYIEYGGDMEDYEHRYVGHRLCRGNTLEEVLKDYQQYFDNDISNGRWYGREIKMIEVPENSEQFFGSNGWGKLKIIKE